jgi:hypothetical protein
MDTYRTYLDDPLAGARFVAGHRFASVTASLFVSARELRQDGMVRREVDFTLERPGAPPQTRTIFWEIAGPLDLPPLDTLDFAALATLFIAMKHRARLVIRGPVTSIMLRNLEELNEAWNQLRPHQYGLIPIEADEIVSDTLQSMPGNLRAVLSFSGGLDASFTLVRHLSGHAGHRTGDVATAVLIHGFDIPLSAQAAFERARASAEDALAAVGLSLTTLRTNWREVAETDWEMDHMAAIAACLHNFAGACELGLFGSDLTYAFNFWPWGSNPAIDPFLSGGRFTLRSEGQAFLRTARAELVATVPAIAERLRVCWAGPLTGTNCGRCEKCIRTQLNFLAAGHDPGPAFPVRATLRDILFLNAPHPGSVNYLVDILQSANRNGTGGAWRVALGVNLVLNRILLPLRPLLGDWVAPLRVLRRLLKGTWSMGAIPGVPEATQSALRATLDSLPLPNDRSSIRT